MPNLDMESNTHLWILKLLQLYTRVVRSSIIASLLIAYLPIIITGLLLQIIYKYPVFTRGCFIALLWLAIAPILIKNVFKIMITFFNTHRHIFKDKEKFDDLCNQEIQRIQSSVYLLFGLPWSVIITTLLLFTVYYNAPFTIKIWAVISFFSLFLITSIGFYGIYVLLGLLRKMLNSGLIFNPYHPDKFGGIADFGRFGVKIAFCFSSGALVLPLALEIVQDYAHGNPYLNIAVYYLAGIFIAVMFSSFFVPILQVKSYVDPQKENLLLQARQKLDAMLDEFEKHEDVNLKKGVDIGIYYYFHYRKLQEIKNYPFDFRVILEFCLSFIIPIAVAIMQIYFD